MKLASETDDVPSPVVSEIIGFRRRHRSAMSPAAVSPGEHGIDNRTEDIQAKLRSRHKSSIDDRRLTIDMDDPNREQQGPCLFYALLKIIVMFKKFL